MIEPYAWTVRGNGPYRISSLLKFTASFFVFPGCILYGYPVFPSEGFRSPPPTGRRKSGMVCDNLHKPPGMESTLPSENRKRYFASAPRLPPSTSLASGACRSDARSPARDPLRSRRAKNRFCDFVMETTCDQKVEASVAARILRSSFEIGVQRPGKMEIHPAKSGPRGFGFPSVRLAVCATATRP